MAASLCGARQGKAEARGAAGDEPGEFFRSHDELVY
jgi:hypothetical protein